MPDRSKHLVDGVVIVVIATLIALGATWLSPEEPSQGARPTDTAPIQPPQQWQHTWRNIQGKFWQIVTAGGEDPAATDAREGTRGQCPVGMVEVSGNMLVDPGFGVIDQMQLRACTNWIRREFPERCAQFDREAWVTSSAKLKRKPMRYCIDRFEYPNVAGQYPVIFVSWYEANQLCQEQGKRLCNEDEWTFACEGEEGRPYPYGDGYTRNSNLCVTDQQWRQYDEGALWPRSGERAGRELDRLWRGKPSGQPGCRSSFGVYDMTGNVDEWTTSTQSGGNPSILKGGYWGPVRTRCRPATRSHDETHTFYQQGLRCCQDLGAARPKK